jgi:hypothetical protein
MSAGTIAVLIFKSLLQHRKQHGHAKDGQFLCGLTGVNFTGFLLFGWRFLTAYQIHNDWLQTDLVEFYFIEYLHLACPYLVMILKKYST